MLAACQGRHCRDITILPMLSDTFPPPHRGTYIDLAQDDVNDAPDDNEEIKDVPGVTEIALRLERAITGGRQGGGTGGKKRKELRVRQGRFLLGGYQLPAAETCHS